MTGHCLEVLRMVASVMIKKSVSTHSCEHEGERVGIVCHINDDILYGVGGFWGYNPPNILNCVFARSLLVASVGRCL